LLYFFHDIVDEDTELHKTSNGNGINSDVSDVSTPIYWFV